MQAIEFYSSKLTFHNNITRGVHRNCLLNKRLRITLCRTITLHWQCLLHRQSLLYRESLLYWHSLLDWCRLLNIYYLRGLLLDNYNWPPRSRVPTTQRVKTTTGPCSKARFHAVATLSFINGTGRATTFEAATRVSVCWHFPRLPHNGPPAWKGSSALAALGKMRHRTKCDTT